MMTIEVADCENIKIDLSEEDSKLTFSATSNGQKYGMVMELYDKIVKEESKWNTKGRNVILSISKADKEQEEWWPRITKDKVKNQLITIDWAKWVDPDDEEDAQEAPGMGAGGDFDPSQMQSFMQNMQGGGMGGMGGLEGMMGGMGGMGGMMGGDSDDDEGEEAQVDPHLPGEEAKAGDNKNDLDDLDGEEEADLKK